MYLNKLFIVYLLKFSNTVQKIVLNIEQIFVTGRRKPQGLVLVAVYKVMHDVLFVKLPSQEKFSFQKYDIVRSTCVIRIQNTK